MFRVLRRKHCRDARWAVLLCAVAAFAGSARADATGPDAWRVHGNTPVTIRMGPGTAYPKTGTLGAGARHLKAVTCVPLFTNAQYDALTPNARDALPPRWCLVEGSGKRGWVAQRHLREDTLDDAAAHAPHSSYTMPGQDAVAVARAFFADYNAHPDRLYHDPARARRYFYTGLAGQIARNGFDGGTPYPGQDSDITDLHVRIDPAHPPLRGMTTVLATYRDYGQPQQMRLYLRSDPKQGGQQRILRIETADGRTIE